MKTYKLLNVLPECFVDTNLIEYLLNAGVNHQHCCSKVVEKLNNTFAEQFAIGIIDKDKVELGYIQECNEIAKTEHLTLMKHRERHQYLITITPAVDGFILDCAEKQGVDLARYNLPKTLKDFTKIAKSVTSNTDNRFKMLFMAIKDNDEIKTLKSVLKYLCKNKYGSNVQIIKEFFPQI